jgi:hypothetical protein
MELDRVGRTAGLAVLYVEEADTRHRCGSLELAKVA